MLHRRAVLAAGATAAVLLGGSDAFAPSPLSLSHTPACSARASAPALRMGLGDMFKNAFDNNPNIPKAAATGPGSPGFSVPKEQPLRELKQRERVSRSETTTTLELDASPVATPAAWQQAIDPTSGNPYWSLYISLSPYATFSIPHPRACLYSASI